jgi:hypothetical protein
VGLAKALVWGPTNAQPAHKVLLILAFHMKPASFLDSLRNSRSHEEFNKGDLPYFKNTTRKKEGKKDKGSHVQIRR